MRPTNYLFINKSEQSGSLSHSEKPERIKIHSHVQLGKLESRKNEDDKEVLDSDSCLCYSNVDRTRKSTPRSRLQHLPSISHTCFGGR